MTKKSKCISIIGLLILLQSCNPYPDEHSNPHNSQEELPASEPDIMPEGAYTSALDEYLLIDGHEGKLKILNGTTYEQMDELFYECAYAISDDLSTLATGHFQDKYVKISSFPDNHELIRIPYFQDITSLLFCVRDLALSSSGKYVSMAGPTGEVEIADTHSGEIISRFNTGNTEVFDMGFSPDEKYFAAVGVGAKLVIWNMESNSEAFTYADSGDNIDHVVFSPDNKEMAILSNQNVMRFFSLESGNITGIYEQNGPSGDLQSRPSINTIITDAIYDAREISWSTKEETGRYADCVTPEHGDFVETYIYNASLSKDGTRIAVTCSFFDTDQLQILVRDFNTGEILFVNTPIDDYDTPIPYGYFIP